MAPGEDDARRGMTSWLSEFVLSDNAGGVFYGWRLVVVAALIVIVGREMGGALTNAAWASRAVDHVGIGPPWNAVVIAVAAIGWLLSLFIAGRGVDRFGPRRMAQVGLPLVGLAVLSAALPISGIVQVAFAGIAALALIGAYVPAITTLNNWFRERLGLALALMLFAVALSKAVVGSVLPVLLAVSSWWMVTAVFGAAIVVVAFLLARLVRDRPEDWGEHPDGLAPAPDGSIPNYSWREAMRSGRFWMLMAAGACVAAAASTANVYAYFAISPGGATLEAIDKFGTYKEYASTAGILVGGLASYRLPVRYVLFAAALAQAVGIGLLLAGFGPVLLETAVLLGVASGMATAPAIAAIGVYFGRRSFGAILVTSFFIEHIAASGLLPAVGYISSFDPVLAMHIPIFVVAAVGSIVGAGLYWRLGPPRLSPSQQGEHPAVS